jgi:hypothetical protein
MDCDADDDNDNVVSDRLESGAGLIPVLCCGLLWSEADSYFSSG